MKVPTKFTRKKVNVEMFQIVKTRKSCKFLSRPLDTHMKIAFVMFTWGDSSCSQLKSFKESLPEDFRSTMRKLVVAA